ncbi:MAG: MFS transporter [Acholeplasmataceae bacterium]|nr:MAG: MFS transporter [Acholeplasmataceae bacterium]
MKELKLNYRSTFFIGFGFFSILMLWQIYNTYAPIFLGRLLSSTGEIDPESAPLVGFIMALDNFFALFMLPIFGILSDRTKTRFGRRIPYIVVGMFVAALIFPLIAVAYILNSLVGVIIMMLMVLIIMNIYRNPAVSLMPDVTPKPLRSKANGIINLIGYVGAIIGGGLVIIFGESIDDPILSVMPFLIVSGVMLVAMLLLFIKIKENKLVEETKEDMVIGEAYSTALGEIGENVPLSRSDKINMFLILFAVFLWFSAFNSIETFISSYTDTVLGRIDIAGTITIILVLSAMITFIPAGLLASRLGRKFSVIGGLALMGLGLFATMLLHEPNALFFGGISVIGVGWAFINVNSYPMIVEMSHKDNVGRYTGYYYTSSMLAQSFTPIVAGAFIRAMASFTVLFPYALVLVVIAFVTFFFVKENKDVVKEIKKGLDAFDVD